MRDHFVVQPSYDDWQGIGVGSPRWVRDPADGAAGRRSRGCGHRQRLEDPIAGEEDKEHYRRKTHDTQPYPGRYSLPVADSHTRQLTGTQRTICWSQPPWRPCTRCCAGSWCPPGDPAGGCQQSGQLDRRISAFTLLRNRVPGHTGTGYDRNDAKQIVARLLARASAPLRLQPTTPPIRVSTEPNSPTASVDFHADQSRPVPVEGRRAGRGQWPSTPRLPGLVGRSTFAAVEIGARIGLDRGRMGRWGLSCGNQRVVVGPGAVRAGWARMWAR